MKTFLRFGFGAVAWFAVMLSPILLHGQNQLVGNLTVTNNATFSARTATRVPFFGTAGILSDDADMTFATDTLTVTKLIGSTSITDSGLTATRVTFAGTGGLLSDSSAFTFNSGTGALSATSFTGSGSGLTFGTNVATFLNTPTSANLAAAVTDETGSGSLVFGTTPTLATPVINGLATGTGVASAATASTIVTRDSSANINADNFNVGYTTTATAAGTTTLTVDSTFLQYFTGSTTQTVVLPVTSTLALGQRFMVVNNSSGTVTVNSSGSNLVATVTASTSVVVTCILTSGTSAASWNAAVAGAVSSITGTTNQITASASTGAVTLSIPINPTLPGNVTVTGNSTVSGAGAVSAPGGIYTGTWYSGGSATTTKPYILIEPAGTTSTAWSTNGTGLGVNAASGFTGNLFDYQLAGASILKLTTAGLLTIGGSNSILTLTGSGTINGVFAFNGQSGTGLRINVGGGASISMAAQTTFTASSGTDNPVNISPTYNQTSTAGATDLLINRTQTAVGSGTQLLIDGQVGGVSKFSVSNNGNVKSAGFERVTGDATNATATMSSLSDLTVTVAAGVHCVGTVTIFANDSTGADGLAFDLGGGSCTFTDLEFGFTAQPTGSTLGTVTSTTSTTAVTLTVVSTSDAVYTISFGFTVNAAGTFIPRFAQNSHSAGTATVRKNSSIQLVVSAN